MHTEWFDLYLKDGTYVERWLRGMPLPEGMYHNIVTIFTFNSKHELLLTRRAEGKSYAGAWETTAGSVLSGETIIDAAVRELAEETGIVCDPSELISLGTMETTNKQAWMRAYAIKRDVPIEAITLQPGETDGAKWVPLDWKLATAEELAEPVRMRLIYFWQQLETIVKRPNALRKPWLDWAKRLQSLAQQGLQYTKDPYDAQRFREISGIAAEIVSNKTGIPEGKVLDLFCNEKGYQTPKVECRGAVFRDGRVLLVQERATGLWSMPGGWCDIGLGLGENTVKECLEEAGMTVEAKTLVAVENRSAHDYTPYPYEIYKCYVLCEWQSGAFVENLETVDAKFFALDQLPPLSPDRVNRRAIAMCFDAAASESWQTRFD